MRIILAIAIALIFPLLTLLSYKEGNKQGIEEMESIIFNDDQVSTIHDTESEGCRIKYKEDCHLGVEIINGEIYFKVMPKSLTKKSMSEGVK